MAWHHSRKSTAFVWTLQPDVHPPSHPVRLRTLPGPATALSLQPRPTRSSCTGSPKARTKNKNRRRGGGGSLLHRFLPPILLRFARYGYGWAFSPFEYVAAHSSGEDGWAVLAHIHQLACAFWREGTKFSTTPVLWALISDISSFQLSVAWSKEGGTGWVHGHPAMAPYPRQVPLETAFCRNFWVTAAAGQLLQRRLYFSVWGNHIYVGMLGDKPWGNPSGQASGQLLQPPRAAATAPGPTGQHGHKACMRGTGDAGTAVAPVVINNNFMWPSVIWWRRCR